MGALTQGDRSSTSGSQTLDAFNYDTIYGIKALKDLIDIINGELPEQGLPSLDPVEDVKLIQEAAEFLDCLVEEVTFSKAAAIWLETVNLIPTKKLQVKKFFNRIY